MIEIPTACIELYLSDHHEAFSPSSPAHVCVLFSRAVTCVQWLLVHAPTDQSLDEDSFEVPIDLELEEDEEEGLPPLTEENEEDGFSLCDPECYPDPDPSLTRSPVPISDGDEDEGSGLLPVQWRGLIQTARDYIRGAVNLKTILPVLMSWHSTYA